jgi:hypothetical protein
MNDTAVFVAMARVLEVTADGRVRVQRLDAVAAPCIAEWALPFRYEPVVGDLLQVIGQGQRTFVVAVSQGRGRTSLAFRGAMTLRGAGAMRLGSDAAIRLRAPALGLHTTSQQVEAETITQSLGDCDTAIADEMVERAGRSARQIEGEDVQVAGTQRRLAAHRVTIDGELLRIS